MPRRSSEDEASLNVLLPTLGSSGDVNPFVALGVALKARGHRVSIITNPIFQAQIEAQGLRFLGVGSEAQARSVIADPDLWHARRSFGVVSKVLIPSLEGVFRIIEQNADRDTVMAFSTLALGARLAQEKLEIPAASVHLQPGIFRSVHEQGMFANLRLSRSQPRWLKRLIFNLADRLVLDRHLYAPLNDLRKRLGLAPVDRIMHRWLHSPQLVIAFFPEWFAAPQPDWPQNLHLVGFPLWDAGKAAGLDAGIEFLDDGAAPIVFTPGSAGATMHEFFRTSVRAAAELHMRAMLVTNHPEQTPTRLPPGIKVFGYLPFSSVVPRAALLVYHGGIGTLAQGVRAAVPHLVVPHAHDQFDNAWRIKRLGLGESIVSTSYNAHNAVRAIRRLLDDNVALQARRRKYSQRIDSATAIERAVHLIEQLKGSR